jgi:hypothetical protein
MAPEGPSGWRDRYRQFKPPSDGFGDEEKAPIEGAFDSPPEDRALAEGGFPSSLLEAREAVVDVLRRQGELRTGVRSASDLTEATNILGVGVGRASASDYAAGRVRGVPGLPVLTVYLAQDRSHEHVRDVVIEELGVRAATSDDVDLVPVVTGIIEARGHNFELRPAPGGISLGHVDLPGFGTLGCLVTGRRPPRDERVMILSNNHVIAQINGGTEGDCICQPAPGDGGSCPANQVAVLDRFVPISFGGGAVNYVDGATAWAWPDRVRPEMLYMALGVPNFIPVSSQPAAAYQGMTVGKSGTKTELTVGSIREVGATAWIDYGGGNFAFFAGLITIQAAEGSLFSDKGDSGSLVWTWDVDKNPVGLFFADGGGTSFANPIDIVLAALDCDILT